MKYPRPCLFDGGTGSPDCPCMSALSQRRDGEDDEASELDCRRCSAALAVDKRRRGGSAHAARRMGQPLMSG